MSSRNPSGTFTKAAPAGPTVGAAVTRSTDRARFCGCCCKISRRVLLVILAFFYLAIVLLSMISVAGGVTENMTEYHGQVKISATNFKVTSVGGKPLNLWTGWLKFNNGKPTDSLKDLSDLSHTSAALGYITAFLLLVSAIVAIWKLSIIAMCSCCKGSILNRRSLCLGITMSIILILFLASFYAITSRDLDNLAHSSLGLAASIDLSMKPGYAWYCGFFAAITWTLVSIFSCGMPPASSQEYHQF